jgi:hypothetical protein
MFQTFAQRFQQLDFLGARYYDNVNDGFDGNNNATDSLCVWPSAPSHRLWHVRARAGLPCPACTCSPSARTLLPPSLPPSLQAPPTPSMPAAMS